MKAKKYNANYGYKSSMNNYCIFPYTKQIRNPPIERRNHMSSNNEEKEKDIIKSKLAKNNYDIDIQACSSMDCTGLIPATPGTEEELEAYQDIYHYIPHANVKKDETK
jgi:hypothetical protein